MVQNGEGYKRAQVWSKDGRQEREVPMTMTMTTMAMVMIMTMTTTTNTHPQHP